jgi:putative transposase
MENEILKKYLQISKKIRKIDDSLILHTDQGIPYRSTRWKTIMDTFSITPSMSRKANAPDNTCIESFFSYLKTEIQKELQTVKSIEGAKQRIHDYIRYYNLQRRQGVLHDQIPIRYAQAS